MNVDDRQSFAKFGEAPVTVVLGREGAEPEIIRDVSVADVLEIAGRVDEETARRARVSAERLSRIETDVLTDPSTTVDYYILQAATARRDAALSSEILQLEEPRLRLAEEVQLGRATQEDLDRMTAQTDRAFRGRMDLLHRVTDVGTVVLYEHVKFGGGSKTVSITWPNLNWWPYKFNDKTSSIKAFGFNWLFEHDWYRGRVLTMIGLPYFAIEDLRQYSFNDIITSVACAP